MYSPIFRCAYKILNKARSLEEIREQILQAIQFDRRTGSMSALCPVPYTACFRTSGTGVTGTSSVNVHDTGYDGNGLTSIRD